MNDALLFQSLPKPFFVLAPLDDVTDTVFRQVIAGCARPDVFFTEFVNADGLQSVGRKRLLPKLKFGATEQPLIAQIWGKNPDNFFKTAQELADGTFAKELGLPDGINFAGIDLNMGCPDKTVVKNGTCSALINDRELASAIIKATQDGAAGKLPISVKTRLGFSSVDMTWPEFLLGHNLDMLTIHGRTRKEMSKVPAQWDRIGEVRELRDKLSPTTLIVGNGDVMSREQGKELTAKYQLDGVMIGRGALHDSYVFAENSPWESMTREQRLQLYMKHVQLFADTWKEGERAIPTLNKFCKLYINGFDGAKELREKLMKSSNTKDLLEILSGAQSDKLEVI